MPRKVTEKPYNNKTMTSAAFFGFIRSALRQKSRWWKPLQQAKINARKPYKGANKRQKWQYQCSSCKAWFIDSNVVVDHIVECGELNSFNDLPAFAERLFCEVKGFQVMCKPCHQLKTNAERIKRKELKLKNK